MKSNEGGNKRKLFCLFINTITIIHSRVKKFFIDLNFLVSVFRTVFLLEVTFEIVLDWHETWARQLLDSYRLLVFISAVVNF